MNVQSLVELILLLNWALAWKKLLSHLRLWRHLQMLRCIHDLLRAIRLLLNILHWLNKLLVRLLLGLDHVDLASILVYSYLSRRELQNLLELLPLINRHLSNFAIYRVGLVCRPSFRALGFLSLSRHQQGGLVCRPSFRALGFLSLGRPLVLDRSLRVGKIWLHKCWRLAFELLLHS